MERLRAVFAGTAGFSVPSLRTIAQRCDVLAVVTQPDRAGSRGAPAPRPVADCARELGINILQPEKIRAPEVVEQILDLRADVLVVAAYGQILPVALLDGFRLGGVNVHASLLPRWRGASPINAAIIAGDPETGVSIMRMEAGLDTGPVYTMSAVRLDQHSTAPDLTVTLAHLGADLLGPVLDRLGAGTIDPTAQDDTQATLAPRLSRDDGRVDWAVQSADEVDRMVRGLAPWPGVTAPLGGQTVRVWEGRPLHPETIEGKPGAAAFDANGTSVTVVAAGPTLFRVDEVQAPNARQMNAADYLRGRHL